MLQQMLMRRSTSVRRWSQHLYVLGVPMSTTPRINYGAAAMITAAPPTSSSHPERAWLAELSIPFSLYVGLALQCIACLLTQIGLEFRFRRQFGPSFDRTRQIPRRFHPPPHHPPPHHPPPHVEQRVPPGLHRC